MVSGKKIHMAVLNVLDRFFSLPDKSASLFAGVGLQGSDPTSAAHCLLSFLQTSSRQLLSFLGMWQAGVQQPAEIITQQTDLPRCTLTYYCMDFYSYSFIHTYIHIHACTHTNMQIHVHKKIS